MEKRTNWEKDARKEPVVTDLGALVPQDHLLRKIERVMDYDWIDERVSSLYCHDNGRPGTDPVVLIKMVLIRHLFGIPSLRQRPISGSAIRCRIAGPSVTACSTRSRISLR